MGSSAKPPQLTTLLSRPGTQAKKVLQKAEKYINFYDSNSKTDSEETKARKENQTDVTNCYYDLVTDFYEYGWGDCFHFAHTCKGELRDLSIVKHEYRLPLKLSAQPGQLIMDVGCGIGGPARNIASFSEARVVGVNFNDYQLARAEALTKAADLTHLCSFTKGDFNDLPFESNSFDHAYAIEATCHAADPVKVYSEVFRAIKPGGKFVFYEWIVTDKYDSSNSNHKQIVHDILEGDGLPELRTQEQVETAMKEAGFENIQTDDLALKSPVPWWRVLTPQWTVSDLKITPLGRWLTHLSLIGMEKVGLAPAGAVKVHKMLCKGADGLVLGGKEGIFTPMLLVSGQKPAK